jgi:hypothetical protein
VSFDFSRAARHLRAAGRHRPRRPARTLGPGRPRAGHRGIRPGRGGRPGCRAHGGFDLANAIHPPSGGVADATSQVDPLGLLTFGFAGLAAAGFAMLIGATHGMPSGLAALRYRTGVLAALSRESLISRDIYQTSSSHWAMSRDISRGQSRGK